MKTMQIMSTAPSAASSVKTQIAQKTATQGTQGNSFDDALKETRAQDAPQDRATDAKKDAAQNGKDTAQNVKDAAQDAKDAAEDAAVDAVAKGKTKTQGKDAANAKDADGKEQGNTETGGEELAAELSGAASLALAAAAATETGAATESAETVVQAALSADEGTLAQALPQNDGAKLLAEHLTENLQSFLPQETANAGTAQNLQTLLPQDAAQGAKQQQLLAMLSGQTITPQETDSLAQNLLQETQNALAANTAQAANLDDLAALGAQRFLTANLTDAAAETVTAQTENAPQAAMLAAGTQAADSQGARLSDFANLFGTQVSVEDAQELPLAQQIAAMENAQSGTNGEAAQQSFAQLMQENSENTQTAQTAEAPQSSQETSANTETAPTQGITSFQQTLAAQNAESAQAAAPTQQPQTDYNIQQQIVDQARLLQRGADTEMVIHLKPEHLGDLTLRVSVSADGSVNASFHSPSAEVRAILENTMVQLKTELNNQGIKVDNVSVYAGLGDGLPQGDAQQQNAQQGGSQRQHSAQESAEAFEDGQELAAALAAQREGLATDGVDYRV